MPRQPVAFRHVCLPEAARKLKDQMANRSTTFGARRDATASSRKFRLPRGYYKAFVELHIEQGPLLERERMPLGIVTKIAAPASARITIEGAGGHAGGVLMPDRHDALCAAAELILAIENAARASGSTDTRRDGRDVRRVPRRREQHSEPRAAQPRCSRHGSRAARLA